MKILIKNYRLTNQKLVTSNMLASLFVFSKKIQNTQNKNFNGFNNPLVLVEQNNSFYQRNYNNQVFFCFKKFGYKNVLKYGIFKHKLFERKKLTDLYITDNFLVKNIEFVRFFLHYSKIKNTMFKRFLFAIMFGTSWRIRYKLLVRYASKNKKSKLRLLKLRKVLFRKRFSFKIWRSCKKYNFNLKLRNRLICRTNRHLAQIGKNKITKITKKKIKNKKKLIIKKKRLINKKKNLIFPEFDEFDKKFYEGYLSFFYFQNKKKLYFNDPIRYHFQRHIGNNRLRGKNFLNRAALNKFYKNWETPETIFDIIDTETLKEFNAYQRIHNPSYFWNKGSNRGKYGKKSHWKNNLKHGYKYDFKYSLDPRFNFKYRPNFKFDNRPKVKQIFMPKIEPKFKPKFKPNSRNKFRDRQKKKLSLMRFNTKLYLTKKKIK